LAASWVSLFGAAFKLSRTSRAIENMGRYRPGAYRGGLLGDRFIYSHQTQVITWNGPLVSRRRVRRSWSQWDEIIWNQKA